MNCPICNSKQTTKVDKTTHVWQKKFDINFCGSCGLYFLPEVPTEKEIKYHYEKEYYSNIKGIVSIIKNMFRKFRSYSQRKYILDNKESEIKSVLEIGASNGFLLRTFKKIGCEVSGTEYSIKMRAVAKKKYKIDLSDSDFFQLEGNYDLIMMSHVFEHFVDIRKVLKKTKKLLSKNGSLFLEVPFSPNPDAVSQKELSNYLRTDHIYNFKIKSMKMLLEQEGFEVVSIDRLFYNLPSKLKTEQQQAIGKAFVQGTNPGINNIFTALSYILFSIFNKAKSFKKIDPSIKWVGKGDSIRVVAIKK